MPNDYDAKAIAEAIIARHRGQRNLSYDSEAGKFASEAMKREAKHDIVPPDSARASPWDNEAKRLAAEIIYQYQQRQQQQPEQQPGPLPEAPGPIQTIAPTITPPIPRPPVQQPLRASLPGFQPSPEPTPYMPGLRGKEALTILPKQTGVFGPTAALEQPEFEPPAEPSIIRKGLEVAKRAPFAFGAVSPERYEEIVGDLRERQVQEAVTTQERQYWRNLYAGGQAGPMDAGLVTYQAFWNGLSGSGMSEEAQYYPKQAIAGNIMGTVLGFYLAGRAPTPGAGKLLRLAKTPWVARFIHNATRSAKTFGLRDFVRSLGAEVTRGEGPDAKKVFKETTDGIMWGILFGMAETAREPVREFLTHKKVIEELPEFKRTLDKKYMQHLFTGEGTEEQTLIATTLGTKRWKDAVKATRMGKEFEFKIPPRQVVTWMDRGYYAQLKRILGLERYAKTGTPTMKGEPSLKTTKEPLATGFKKTIAVQKGTKFAPGEVVPETKIIGEGAAMPRAPVSIKVQRIDEPGVSGGVEKPQGLYTSPAGIKSPHAELGGKVRTFQTNPKANVLDLGMTGKFQTNRGTVDESAGIAAARKLLGDDEVSRMMSLPKERLTAEMQAKYPNVQWDKYYDQQEIVEGLAGVEARKQGYDAILATDKDPSFNEYVALTDNAFISRKPGVAPTPTFGLTSEAARLERPRPQVRQEGLDLGVGRKVPERRAAKPPPTQAEIARAEREKAAGLFGPGQGKAGGQLGLERAAPRELEDQISEIETGIMEKTAGRPLSIGGVQSAATGLSDKQYLEALKEIAPQAGTITSEQVEDIMAKHGKAPLPQRGVTPDTPAGTTVRTPDGRTGILNQSPAQKEAWVQLPSEKEGVKNVLKSYPNAELEVITKPALDIAKYQERLERAKGQLRHIKENPGQFTDAEYGKQTREWEHRIADIEDDLKKLRQGTHPAQIEAAELGAATEPIAVVTAPHIGAKAQIKADRLRDLAKGLQKRIDEKLHPAISDQPLTARRARIAAGMSADAEHLRQVQGKLNAIADGIEDGTLPKDLRGITNKSQVEFLHRAAKSNHEYPKHKAGEQDWAKKSVDKDLKALSRMDIDSEQAFERAKKAFAELKTDLMPSASAKEAKIRRLEADLLGRSLPGFFPTPEPVARLMLEIADIQPGMTVLEPSAGKGDLADVIREAHPKATLSTIEINSELRKILEVKGHKIIGQDIFEHTKKYDIVFANPPFEKMQDMKHVRHYFNLVEPGGKLVTLMSEHAFFASDKQSVAFRDWLTKVGGTTEKLDPKSFTGREAFRQTGVAARIVTIEKPVITEEVARPVLTTGRWEDIESAIKRYQKQGVATRVETETTPQGKRYKLYEKTPVELRAAAPGKKTVKVKFGRKTLDVPDRRAPQVRAIRDKIEDMIDVQVEGYIRESINAPKAGRYPLADQEDIVGRGGTVEWTGQKSVRPEITKGISSKKLRDALERKGKSALWRQLRETVRDELEFGGTSFEGKAFPPDPRFAKLMADAKDLSRNAITPARPGTKALPENLRGPILPETQKLEEQIDKLERTIVELRAKRDKAIGMKALDYEGEDPTKITTEIVTKEKELDTLREQAADMRSKHFRMGGPRPVPPEELPKNLQEKALRYGTHDPMTGLWRKDPFTKYVQLHAEQAIKTGEGFSVVFIDVNGFKEINDTFGHDVGDKVIEAFGKILAGNVKASDIAARWGGDEFGIFLPIPDKKAAKAVFQRIADVVDAKGLAGRKLSVSGGIATFPADGKTAAELIVKADEAMYEAKNRFKADMTAKKKSNVLDVTEAEASQLGELMGVKDILDTPVHAQLDAIETEIQSELDLFEEQGSKYVMNLKRYFRIANKIRDGFWTFGPLRREFPGVYERSLEMYAKFNAAAPNAASLMEDTLDKVRLDPRQRETALYAWEDKRLRPKLQKPLSEVVDKFDNLVQLYEKAKLKAGLLAELFPKSAILRNLDQISKIQAQPRITTKNRQEIAELLKENQELTNMRWLTHRSVAAAVLRNKWAKLDPRGRRKFIGGLRQLSFRYRQRKGKLYLKDYVELGLLKPEDVDIRRVFIDIVKDAEEKLALKETWDYAKGMTWNAEKGIKLITWGTNPPRGWVAAKKEILGFYAPEMEGAWLHPSVASMYEQMAAMTKPMPQPWGAIYSLFGKAKLMFFHKPGIILWYDNIPQRAFAGAYGLNPVRELRGFWTNLWKVWMKHPDYRRRRAMGLFSSPYLVGGKTMTDEVQIILNRTAKEYPKWKVAAERIIETPLTTKEFTSLVGPVVHAHRMATWTICDNPSRMQQVDRLMAMGHTELEAVKIISRASGAYAEPSPLFKKSLAPLFLVTNFRLLMPLEIIKALAINPTEALIRTAMAKMGRGKPLPPHEIKRRAKAFVATVALPLIIHFYMQQRGWKVDKFGWKWYKTVKVEVDGKMVEKEVVIAINNIINMPAKWLHRAMIYDPLGPPRPFQMIKNVFWWEIHPLWAATIDIIRNRGRFGAYEIYRQEDPPQVKLGKAAHYFFNQVARVYPAVVGEVMHKDFLSDLSPKERKAQKAIFDKALNGFERAMTYFGGYSYTRMPRAQLFEILDDKRVSAWNRRENGLENEAEREGWSTKELEQRTDRLNDVMGDGGIIDRYNHKRCDKPFKPARRR